MIKTIKSSRLNNAALLLSQSRRKEGQNTSQYMANNTKKRQDELDSTSMELTDILSKRYRANNFYPLIMFILALGIVWTAVLTAEQVQQYHNDYMRLQKMKVEHRNLQIENQRLIIEQQTFSATPQIASRAVTQLGMYSPSTKDKLILQPASTVQGDRLNIEQRSVTPTEDSAVNQGGGDE